MPHEKKKAAQWFGLCFYCQKHGHSKRNCLDRKSHPAASGRSASGLCNSELSGPKAGKERKTVEPRKTQVNLATTKHGWSRFQMIKAVAHGAHGRSRRAQVGGETHSISFCGVGGSRISCQASRSVRFWHTAVSGERAEENPDTTNTPDLWQTPVSPTDWPHLQNLNLTREVRELTPVHVIIGLDSYFRFLGTQVIHGGDDDTVAVRTLLGTDDHLNAVLWKFWELEAISILPLETESGQTEMERRFKESLYYEGNRYSVGLLWKSGMANLLNNYTTTIQRYRAFEKRLSRDFRVDQDYTAVMQSYFENGWAEEASVSSTPGKTWYLPHHAVYQQGTTGKRKC
ncbi:hypothetical protein T07_3984 [Trichinella nelsoni]|uniref:CCHC-type domain-containing protein n=1 Tax=Trichinella nelsoni TaxID=6336 RepID=A0A0V0RPQ2_9BILA|nr:hypothetical protein T07_3984 [Trichinella nelsoni]